MIQVHLCYHVDTKGLALLTLSSTRTKAFVKARQLRRPGARIPDVSPGMRGAGGIFHLYFGSIPPIYGSISVRRAVMYIVALCIPTLLPLFPRFPGCMKTQHPSE